MDISTRKDIEKLVTSFYDKVKQDDTIGFIFNDIVKVNWDEHLPVVFDFWESILLSKTTYQRNAMGVHFEINRKVPLEKQHFERWMMLFTGTVNELFDGPVAGMAIKRAGSIAEVMLFKINQENTGKTVHG